MRKTVFTSIATGTMALFLMNACAEDSNDTEAVVEQVVMTENAGTTVEQGSDIMDQPVNFSTPGDVEKSLQKVRDQAGDNAYKNVENAMKYVLYYDLSLKNDKEKMYKKLNGKTPSEIIQMMKR
jgi:hypothetical protein